MTIKTAVIKPQMQSESHKTSRDYKNPKRNKTIPPSNLTTFSTCSIPSSK